MNVAFAYDMSKDPDGWPAPIVCAKLVVPALFCLAGLLAKPESPFAGPVKFQPVPSPLPLFPVHISSQVYLIASEIVCTHLGSIL